jgi:hypothetical protein
MRILDARDGQAMAVTRKMLRSLTKSKKDGLRESPAPPVAAREEKGREEKVDTEKEAAS